jgi:tetratricopeptide (TPR) repeat protein
LAYFKEEQYTMAVEHLKICTHLDPKHPFAYNNLAFIYNMHQYYPETINVCNKAKLDNPEGTHNCYRHWAFALFKKGEMAKAIKKIKKAIMDEPADADNWIVWGLILRTVGNYVSAKHKF